MGRVKTSIYVNGDLWKRFRESALQKRVGVSHLLEEIMRDELVDDFLSEVLGEVAESEEYELDFEPIKPAEGVVSELVRAMRDERRDRLSRY